MIETIHNVLLVDVQPSADGFETLQVLVNGAPRQVAGAGRWNEQYSRRDVGRHGLLTEPANSLVFASSSLLEATRPGPSYYFRAYADPSLRRVFELDSSAGDRGWRCDARPHGFFAPPHIIPGEEGRFVPDQTIEVTVKVPPEFVRECRRVQRNPKQVLEGFISDAAGIQNFVNNPRADRFSSNGSDEREMADAWIQRAYGHDAIDLDRVEEQEAEEEDRQLDRDDISALLDDYIERGGTAATLLAQVQALVDQQRDSEGMA